MSALVAWFATALAFLAMGRMDMTCKVDGRLMGFSAVSAVMGVLLGIAALVTGVMGLVGPRSTRGAIRAMAIAGLVVGLLPLAVCALVLFVLIVASVRAC